MSFFEKILQFLEQDDREPRQRPRVTSATKFVRLNHDWNADPNVPDSKAIEGDASVSLEFDVNAYIYDGFAEGERARLIFDDCSIYRLGATNDEGWYMGQCRFSKVAPEWGEFYELFGDTRDDQATGWRALTGAGTRHFLFYLRDGTFECKAANWRFERPAA